MRRRQANMNLKKLILLCFVLSTLSILVQDETNPISNNDLSAVHAKRITYIKNNVTLEAGIESREDSSYPAQLQNILTDNYLVGNFKIVQSQTIKTNQKGKWEAQSIPLIIKKNTFKNPFTYRNRHNKGVFTLGKVYKCHFNYSARLHA